MDKKKYYIIGLISVILDQIVKLIIRLKFNILETRTIINNFFYLTYVKNKGAAFSTFDNDRLFLIIISIILLIIILKYVTKEKNFNKIEVFAYQIIIGGIIGNLIDRVFIGSVIDFLSFKINSYYFPIFNLADSFIVIGIILLLIDSIWKEVIKCKN